MAKHFALFHSILTLDESLWLKLYHLQNQTSHYAFTTERPSHNERIKTKSCLRSALRIRKNTFKRRHYHVCFWIYSWPLSCVCTVGSSLWTTRKAYVNVYVATIISDTICLRQNTTTNKRSQFSFISLEYERKVWVILIKCKCQTVFYSRGF